MEELSGKVVVVTGAAGNLGEAVARCLAPQEVQLLLVDRAEDRLAGVFPEYVGSDQVQFATGVDMNDPESVEAAFLAAAERFGHLDGLVNTVGGYKAGDCLHETSLEIWDGMLTLNARTTFIACRAILPYMLKQRSGAIVNIAARPAYRGSSGNAAYSASKAAVMRLTESLSAEVKGEGINVNCIVPGVIDTPSNRKANPDADTSNWVSADSIADVIRYLLSASAASIHGAAVPVYGLS